MKPLIRSLAASVALVTMVATTGVVAQTSEQQRLVDEARLTVEAFKAGGHFDQFRDPLARAKGLVVVPSLVKAAFIFGGEFGEGVLLTRDSDTGAWGYPVFYTLAAGSVGLQAGVQVGEILLLIMTEEALEKLLSSKVKLGADAGVAAGPIGAGVEVGTTMNIDTDIYVVGMSKGLFGGLSIEGGALWADADANEAYYGRPVTTRSIVIDRTVAEPGAEALRAALAPTSPESGQ